MKRTDLLSKLETVAPALAINDIVPIMTHYWFTGTRLMAYNGHVAISVPLKTDFECAVPGSHMLNLVKASGATEVEFEYKGNELKVTGGKSMKIKLATMDAKDFNFKMPKVPERPLGAKKPAAFLDAIRTCLRSISLDTSTPDYLGVTVIPSAKNKGAFLYGANGITLSRAFVPFKSEPTFERAILPNLFCKQLLALAKDAQWFDFDISVEFDRVLFADKEGVVMFGMLVQTEKPLPFSTVFEKFFPSGNDEKLVPIATKFERILERACIVSATEASPVRTQITVKDGLATFTTKSRASEVSDEMQVPTKHKDASIAVDPKWVRAGVGDFDQLLITDLCITMANADGAYYLISGRD